MFASVCVVTASWWQPLELIYKMTNYFRISWSSQTGNMEKHLLAAESWRGSAKLKRSCMNWWRALCKCHKTPWATLMLVQGAGRASWMSFFGCRVPVAEITYEQEGSQSLTWRSPQGEPSSSWGGLRAGAKWERFESNWQSPEHTCPSVSCKDKTFLSFTLGFLQQRLQRVAQGCFHPSPERAKAVTVIAPRWHERSLSAGGFAGVESGMPS